MAVQIIPIGGDGLAPLLCRYVADQARGRRICYLGQAHGERPDRIQQFYWAFQRITHQVSHLSLFKPHTADLADFLHQQDVIYVGGGNTRSLLALWREWELDRILREVAASGAVLTGVSAGANCWFEYATTDSVPGPLQPIRCLGFVEGSVSPHYDGESQRRPTFHHLIASHQIPAGIGLDDSVAAHFIDGQLHAVVSARAQARAYRVERGADGQAVETPLPTRYLG